MTTSFTYDNIRQKLDKIRLLELSKLLNIDGNNAVELRKGYYKQQNMRNLHYIYLFLLSLYVILFIMTCGMLFFHKESTIKKKFLTLGILFVMPLFITKSIMLLVYAIHFIKKKISIMNISSEY